MFKILPTWIYRIQKLLITERFKLKLALVYGAKILYQKLLLPKPKQQKILFTVGCQRSGTSLMSRIFTHDLQACVYRERSVLTSDDLGNPEEPNRFIRLNSTDKLKKCFGQNKAPLIVVKPLVESQNTLQLLTDFPQAKAVWMYRNYQDVANSLFQRFKPDRESCTGIRDLRYVVQGDEQNWRSQNTSEFTRSTVRKYFSENMNPYDASALFWWVRNRFFVELNLQDHPRVMLCRYENLVGDPQQTMNKIYGFVGLRCNLNPKFYQDIDRNSLGKGSSVRLSPEIEQLCHELLERLDDYYGYNS